MAFVSYKNLLNDENYNIILEYKGEVEEESNSILAAVKSGIEFLGQEGFTYDIDNSTVNPVNLEDFMLNLYEAGVIAEDVIDEACCTPECPYHEVCEREDCSCHLSNREAVKIWMSQYFKSINNKKECVGR